MRKLIVWLTAIVFMISFIPYTNADQAEIAYCMVTPQANITAAERSADELLGVAGLCKMPAILTLCFAVDKGLLSEDATVTVGKRATEISGQTAFLKSGEQIRADELLRASVMISAGDAIWALMENAFGSEDVFLQNISLTMKEIGVEHTVLHALGTNESFSCRELVAMGCAALNSETFLKYCATKYAVLKHSDGRETELANANKLLTSLSGCIGLLTGSSKSDGYCGVFACKRGDTTFVLAMRGTLNSKTRFELATQLFDEAFANYSVYELASQTEPILEAYPVDGGDVESIDLYSRENISLLLSKRDDRPKAEYSLPEVLTAPLDPDFAVGTVTFIDQNGAILYELALYPKIKIAATGFFEILKLVLRIYRNS